LSIPGCPLDGLQGKRTRSIGVAEALNLRFFTWKVGRKPLDIREFLRALRSCSKEIQFLDRASARF